MGSKKVVQPFPSLLPPIAEVGQAEAEEAGRAGQVRFRPGTYGGVAQRGQLPHGNTDRGLEQQKQKKLCNRFPLPPWSVT